MNEEFEKLMRSPELLRAGDDDGWRGVAEVAWQASRKQALDEATAAAFRAWTVAADVGEQANDMINAIRALQKD